MYFQFVPSSKKSYEISVGQLICLHYNSCWIHFYKIMGEKTSWDLANFKTDKMCSTLISMRSAGRKAEKFYLSNWNWMTYLASPFLYIWPLMNWFCILIEKLGNPPTIYSVWNKDKSPVLLFVYLNFFQLSGVVIQSHCLAITWTN